MRWIPVDQDRVKFLGTESAAERFDYADGKRAESQARDEATGLPLWVVDALVIGGGSDRAEIAGVKLPSRDKPVVPMGEIVHFEQLEVMPYTPQGGGRLQFSYRAAGIRQATGQPKAAA